VEKKKLNCWEFKKCGREPDGAHGHDLGVCPATVEERLDGTHEGKNAGRACWVMAGTFCKRELKGTFAQKYSTCEVCDFYKLVKQEEFPRFTLSAVLMRKISN
jgi:hypothetical protein